MFGPTGVAGTARTGAPSSIPGCKHPQNATPSHAARARSARPQPPATTNAMSARAKCTADRASESELAVLIAGSPRAQRAGETRSAFGRSEFRGPGLARRLLGVDEAHDDRRREAFDLAADQRHVGLEHGIDDDRARRRTGRYD